MTKTKTDRPGQAHDAILMQQLHRISHDMRGPIRGMVDMANILATDYSDKLDDQAREYLSILTDCGEKAQQMMSGLVQYVQIAEDTTPFAAVDCNSLVATCVAKLKTKISACNAELIIKPLPIVIADSAQLKLLFQALLDNALKFHATGTKPVITISAEKKDDLWRFCVADNGLGVEQNYGDKIFEIFQRLHGDEEYPGVGLGLAWAQQIIYRHGGKIWHEQHAPQGSAFYFTLPVTE